MTWVRIRSWHAIRTHTRVPGGVITLCGRRAMVEGAITASSDGEPVEVRATSDTLPAGRSCESCLRIVARRAE